MSTNDQNKSERLTLFSICCPCLRPKRLSCRASDIALVMYDKDEPHEYVLEKLVIKRVPLRLFGVEEDFKEYERSLREDTKPTSEKEVAVTNFEEVKSVGIEEGEVEQPKEKPSSIKLKEEPPRVPTEATSSNSLEVNYNTAIDDLLQSNLSFACEPLTEPKSGEELILRTITADDEDDLVAEVDQRIAKMSPDLEQTINVLKAVKPRPVSTQGTPMPVKNQRRLLSRDVEREGIVTKEGYNYMPCKSDHPLLGIHYTLNKTSYVPAVEEASKSVITDFPGENTVDQTSRRATTVDIGTTNYEDATVVAGDETSTLRNSLFNSPSFGNFSDVEDYAGSDNSTDFTDGVVPSTPRRLRNLFKPAHKQGGVGTRDFSVYHAAVSHRYDKKFPPSRCTKKRNLKWKIVINNHAEESKLPPSSSTEFKLFANEINESKNCSIRSRLSF